MAKANGVVTRTYLDKRLGEFRGDFKSYLDKRLGEFRGDFKSYLDKRLGEFKDDFKSELYEIKDEIVGEIKAMREEFDTHQFSHARINEEIQEHDKRISKLEAS